MRSPAFNNVRNSNRHTYEAAGTATLRSTGRFMELFRSSSRSPNSRRNLSSMPHRLETLDNTTFEEFINHLKDMQRNYESSSATRTALIALEKYIPQARKLNVVLGLLGSLIGAALPVVGVIWGVTLAILRATRKNSKIFEIITTQLGKMSEEFLIFERIERMSPTLLRDFNLERCITESIKAYVAFCEAATSFLSQKPAVSILKSLFSQNTERQVQLEGLNSEIATLRKDLRERAMFGMLVQLVESAGVGATGEVNAGNESVTGSTSTSASDPFDEHAPHQTALVQATETPESSQKAGTQLYTSIKNQLRNNKFCGREPQLKQIQSVFFGENSKGGQQKSFNFFGLGGIGKSELAREYAFRYEVNFQPQGIHWIRADTGGNLEEDMAKIAERWHKRHSPESTSTSGQIFDSAAGRKILENSTATKPWLLIFDNVNNWSDIERHWPRCNHGCVLVTSRESLPKTIRQIHSYQKLEGLSDDNGPNLLMSLTQNENWNHIKEELESVRLISRELGGHPLYLANVAGYINSTNETPTRTLDSLRKRGTSARVLSDHDHCCPEPAFREYYTSTISALKGLRLCSLSQDAKRFLNIIAMLDSDGVPEDLFFSDDSPNPLLPFLAGMNRIQYIDFLAVLFKRQLIGRRLIESTTAESRSGTSILVKVSRRSTSANITRSSSQKEHITMHRSIQFDLLNDLFSPEETDERQACFDLCVRLLRKKFPRQSKVQFPQNHLWPQCQRYSSQVICLLRAYKSFDLVARPKSTMEFAMLLNDASNYFWEKNVFSDGLEAINSAVEICEEARFLESETLAEERAHVFTVAASLRAMNGINGRGELYPYYSKALQFRLQQISNLFHRGTATQEDIYNCANALGNMATAYLDLDCHEEAALFAEVACIIKRLLLQAQFKELEISCYEHNRNRAVAYAALGEFEKALELIPRLEAVTKDEKYQAALLPYYHLWANVYLKVGNLSEARKRGLACLEKRKEMFGSSNRGTLDSYYFMAKLEERCGDIEAARKWLTYIFPDNKFNSKSDSTEGTHLIDWPEENETRARSQWYNIPV